MIEFFKGGERSKKFAIGSLDFLKAQRLNPGEVTRPQGEQIFYECDDIKLMAPVPRPKIVWDCMVFLEHFRGRWEKRGWEVPEVFYKYLCYATQSGAVVAGTGDPIWIPCYTRQLDFELELGLYIGKEGINIPEEKAEEYIAGFTIFNDVSARDVQAEEQQMRMGPAKGKNFEHASIMGPCLATPDEIDYNNFKMIIQINGKTYADDISREMFYKFPKIILRISEEKIL